MSARLWFGALLAAIGMCLVAASALWDERVLYRGPSDVNGSITVTEDGVGVRRMRFAGDLSTQTAMDMRNPMHLKSPYFVVMVAAMRFASERPQSVLVVGMGGGALPLYLRNRYPSVVVDAVEYDPAVVRVARDYFGVMEDKRLHVIQGDGRDAVRNADRRYDAIILDAFGAEDYPPHLVTAEFFEEVRAKLAPGGVVIANLLGRSHNARYVDMLGTFLTVFPAVGTVRVPERDQTVVVARRDAVDGDPWELRGGMDVRPLTLGQLGHVIVLRD